MSLSLRINVAVTSIRSAATVAKFESVDIGTYRATLSGSIQTAISHVQENGKHHSRAFEKIIYTGIPWTELLIQWERRSQHASNDNTTPLEEVVAIVLNPCIVPPALRSATAMVFFRMLVEDSTMAKSVSLNPLLAALKRVLETTPSARQRIGSNWMEYIQSNLRLDSVEAYNVGRAHRVISVCKHVANYVDGASILKCMLTLLSDIDNADVTLFKSGKKKRIESSSCPCQQKPKRRRNWRRDLRDYDLDDNMNDKEDKSGIVVASVEVAGGANVERVSRALRQYPIGECDMCRMINSSCGTQLPAQLILLRLRVYKKVLSISRTTTATNVKNELRDGLLNQQSLLSALTYFASRNPGSSSLRLCVVLLADSLHQGYEYLVDYLWVLYEQRPPLGETAMRLYSELIVDCAYFDNVDTCWKALQPLLRHVTSFCESGRLETESTLRVRSLLRCLSYIICYRRHTLISLESNHEWQSFMTMLSLSFGDAEWWISRDMNPVERAEALSTLKALGILSFLVDDSGSGTAEVAHNTKISSQQSWPFPEMQRIRSAYLRMGSSIVQDGFLSAPNLRLSISPIPDYVRRSDKDSTVAPIMDYLNNDSLRTIFSFFGYKRLTKACTVCKAWKSLIESEVVWHQAYMSRFPIRAGNESIFESTGSPLGSWKTLLANKVLAEKALRFKRHSSGWKHRTCGHVGCLMVLKSPAQMEKHYRAHEKRKRKSIGGKNTLLCSKRVKQSVGP